MHFGYKSSFLECVTKNNVKNAKAIASPDASLCKNVKDSSFFFGARPSNISAPPPPVNNVTSLNRLVV